MKRDVLEVLRARIFAALEAGQCAEARGGGGRLRTEGG